MSARLTKRCIDVVFRDSRTGAYWRHRPLLSGLVKQCRYASAGTVSGRKSKSQGSDDDGSLMAKAKQKTDEQLLQDFEFLRLTAHKAPYDPWAQRIDTLDLHIPSITSNRKDATWKDHLSAFIQTQRNWILNAIHMHRMAKDKGIQGVKVKSSWSWKIFTTQSTKDDSWVAPLRSIALDTYKQLNQAVADRDDKLIKTLSIEDMQKHYLKLSRTQDLSRIFVWKFHGERRPCRVVSIRAVPVHQGQEVPNNGSRLLVQALVRFDTLQVSTLTPGSLRDC
ncbi:hypothetical protein AcW1_009445 [Taiwanofungus camphoratus]|nr:hypothetical protein AcW1_009445 [Antrodia cinnamomea]